MSAKEVAKRVIEALPDTATMDDIIHGLYIGMKFARGEREIRDGKGVPHDDAKLRLLRKGPPDDMSMCRRPGFHARASACTLNA